MIDLDACFESDIQETIKRVDVNMHLQALIKKQMESLVRLCSVGFDNLQVTTAKIAMNNNNNIDA